MDATRSETPVQPALGPMRRFAAILSSVAVAAILVYWNWTGAPSRSTVAIPAGSTDPINPSSPPYVHRLRVAVPTILSLAQTKGLTSMPWRLFAIGRNQDTLGIYYATGDGDCVTPKGVYLAETASTVTVEVLSNTARARRACPARLGLARADVELRHPLGHRQLIHAQVATEWSNPHILD